VQQVDHRPQVAAFLDVDLEEVAHVVERRRRQRVRAGETTMPQVTELKASLILEKKKSFLQ
jgi:hypothetical protein